MPSDCGFYVYTCKYLKKKKMKYKMMDECDEDMTTIYMKAMKVTF